jgi:hypothetical protein
VNKTGQHYTLIEAVPAQVLQASAGCLDDFLAQLSVLAENR